MRDVFEAQGRMAIRSRIRNMDLNVEFPIPGRFDVDLGLAVNGKSCPTLLEQVRANCNPARITPLRALADRIKSHTRFGCNAGGWARAALQDGCFRQYCSENGNFGVPMAMPNSAGFMWARMAASQTA